MRSNTDGRPELAPTQQKLRDLRQHNASNVLVTYAWSKLDSNIDNRIRLESKLMDVQTRLTKLHQEVLALRHT